MKQFMGILKLMSFLFLNYYFGFYSAVYGFCAAVVYLEAASLHSLSLGLHLPNGALILYF
jgi:hypothetical protein